MASGTQSNLKVENYLTHIDNVEDVIYLKSKLPDVNIRLFKTSPSYRHIVEACAEYIKILATTTMEGYKKPHGMSGANVAIPFNIIAYVVNRGTPQERAEVMINPHILSKLGTAQVKSNCGSIRLAEPILVERAATVLIEWVDVKGNPHKQTFERRNGGFTLQHEIDHNLGVLITDREVVTK